MGLAVQARREPGQPAGVRAVRRPLGGSRALTSGFTRLPALLGLAPPCSALLGLAWLPALLPQPRAAASARSNSAYMSALNSTNLSSVTEVGAPCVAMASTVPPASLAASSAGQP